MQDAEGRVRGARDPPALNKYDTRLRVWTD